jgi:pyruvate/2-oxoglutarate dehydrogenase complex dihydrolipoamide dehydrogenase (E3) component
LAYNDALRSIDVLIVGAGQGCPPIIEGLEPAGWTFAIAESNQVGGSCVNFGCTPTKAAVASTNLVALARRGAEFGVEVGGIKPDYPEILRQARAFSKRSRSGLEKYFGDHLMRGRARFLGREGDHYRVQIGSEDVLARYVVLGTGTRSLIPKIEGIDKVDLIIAENWVDRLPLPKSMAIVGGGYIAAEMSQFYQRLGCQTTVIDRGEKPLATEDDDVSQCVRDSLESDGVQFLLNTSFERVVRAGHGWKLSCDCPDGPRELESESIFIATGRRANTDDIGLETIGIEPDARTGYIQVDSHLRTSAPNVFAIGDIRGGGLFTSTAWDDGRIVLDYLTGDAKRTTDRLVPYAVFTDPEVGRVGLSEHAATESGRKFRISKFKMSHNGHAEEHRATRGFVKLVIEEGTDQILGAAVAATGASDLVMLFSMMMQTKAPVSVLRDMVVIHPTFTEALQSAVL